MNAEINTEVTEVEEISWVSWGPMTEDFTLNWHAGKTGETVNQNGENINFYNENTDKPSFFANL
jgi:hypothetical protein